MVKEFKTLEEMEAYIDSVTGGAFSIFDIEVLNKEVKKLKEGNVFLEVGIDRGKSYAVAYFSAVDEFAKDKGLIVEKFWSEEFRSSVVKIQL